jgi:hypothetical protein
MKAKCLTLIFASIALCGSNCGTSPTSPGSTSTTSSSSSVAQEWDFVLYDRNDNAVAAGQTSCSPPAGTATGSCGPVVWTLLRTSTFGCTLKVSFEPVFNGSSVRFVNWRAPASGTTCSNVSGFSHWGDGSTLDGPYGVAVSASGSVTISWRSPIGVGGGTSKWIAIKGRCTDCPR